MKQKNLSPTRAILESISDGVFTIDLSWRITYFNRAAEEITGIRREDAIGQHCSDVFRSSMCGTSCSLLETMKTGKPIIGMSGYIVTSDGNRLPISVSTALLRDGTGSIVGAAETFRDLSEVSSLKRELQGKTQIGELESRSPAMQRIFDMIPSVAASPSTVLILGDTGTGKELIARTIHTCSPRKDKPFIAVNCAALPDTLLESELFGYKAGAFTGAGADKPGRFALARGGTLFLDEIGDISPALQIRLLRVLQERVYEPLGSTRSESADVRIIAATNRDLSELVKTGTFREDLFYRINVVRITLPPLCRRKEDIPLLCDQFVRRFNLVQGKHITGCSPETLSLFMAYDWPGNIRELENVIERSFIVCSGDLIELHHLPEELTRMDKHLVTPQMHSAHDLLDAQVIISALQQCGYNRLKAAHYLGIHKSTLFRKIRKLGITVPKK